MHGHAIARARPGMCGIIAGCPSRPESTRCACGISLGLVRGRYPGYAADVPAEGPVWGASCAPTRARGRGARPQARRLPGGPSAGRAVPRAGPTRTNTHRRTRPGRARPAARPRGRGREPEPGQTRVLINSAPARCAGANCAKQRPRFARFGRASPGGRGRRRPTLSGDCRQSSRGEAGPTARAERGGKKKQPLTGLRCSGMREHGVYVMAHAVPRRLGA